VVFLKKEGEQYQAVYGAKSFWKIEQAVIDNSECCSAFIVLRPPIVNLRIDSSLISSQPVYINGVSEKNNPIVVKGIVVNDLKSYIKNTTRKDK